FITPPLGEEPAIRRSQTASAHRPLRISCGTGPPLVTAWRGRRMASRIWRKPQLYPGRTSPQLEGEATVDATLAAGAGLDKRLSRRRNGYSLPCPTRDVVGEAPHVATASARRAAARVNEAGLCPYARLD